MMTWEQFMYTFTEQLVESILWNAEILLLALIS